MKATTYGFLALFLIGIVAAGAYAMPFGNGMFGSDEMKTALESGDYDAYIEAFEENDRPYMAHKMSEEMFEEKSLRFQEMSEHRAEVESAIESGDYDLWLETVEDCPKAEKLKDVITEDNFDTFVELHNAKEDRDMEKVQELATELGLEKPGKHGMKNFRHKGFMNRGE